MSLIFDRLQPLSARDLNKIHSATVDILGDTGMAFESERALRIFKNRGFKVDGKKVLFTGSAIENALETVGRNFTILSRNPRHHLKMDQGSFSVGLGRSAPFIMDHDGNRRSPTTEDYINVMKVGHSLDAIEHVGPLVVPADIPGAVAAAHCVYLMLKYTDKPANVVPGHGVDMLCIVFGIDREKMKEQARKGLVYGQSTINPTSPLIVDASQCDSLLEMAELGVPLVMAPMPITATTGPCTLPGTLILQNCEILAPLVLAQLINPGVPVLYGTVASASDMRTLSAIYGSPEVRLLEYASAQVAGFYGLLSRGDVGLTDSLRSDFQAGAESMFQFINTIRSGINFLPGCGHLGSFLEGSLEKIVLDAELAEYAARFFVPLEFNEENMAVDVIKKVGIQGHYVTQPHTLKHCRKEHHCPSFFNRQTYENWVKGGARDALAAAHEKVLSILDCYERPAMDGNIERELDRYLKDHCRSIP